MPPRDGCLVFAILLMTRTFFIQCEEFHYQEVRKAIDTAFREHSTTTLPELELDHPIRRLGKIREFNGHRYMQVEQGAPELAVITRRGRHRTGTTQKTTGGSPARAG